MAVPSGIIVMWPGTNASIPSGFSRVTSLDGKYVAGPSAGADADLSSSLGQSTHNHTVDDHTHVQDSHSHSVSSGSGSGSVLSGGAGSIPQSTHTHGANPSASATATNQNASITLDAVSNDPPYFEVIFIESDGTQDIPDGALAFFDDASLPTNWDLCDGAGSVPDLTDRFVKGAAAAGDAGGTGGSSDSHTHSNSAHNHTQNAHSHGAASSAGPTGLVNATSALRGSNAARFNHTHSITLGNATATNQSASITMSSEDAQPPFYKLAIIQNNTGGGDTPNDIIALWGDTEASIPTNWSRLAVMDGKFVKGVADTSQIGNTGGGDSHAHTADPHTHTQNAHNHTPTAGSGSTTGTSIGETPASVSTASHTHVWTAANATATNQNTVVTINANSTKTNYPPYQKLIFIKFAEPPTPTTPPPLKMIMNYGI